MNQRGDGGTLLPDDKGIPWLAALFWIAACGNVLLVLIPALREWNHPQGQFSGLAVISLLAIVVGYDWPEGLALVLDHGANTEAQAPWVTPRSCERRGRKVGHQGLGFNNRQRIWPREQPGDMRKAEPDRCGFPSGLTLSLDVEAELFAEKETEYFEYSKNARRSNDCPVH